MSCVMIRGRDNSEQYIKSGLFEINLVWTLANLKVWTLKRNPIFCSSERGIKGGGQMGRCEYLVVSIHESTYK